MTNFRLPTRADHVAMVGKMKRIVSTCHASTAAHRALELYIILVGARWWALLAQLRGV